MSDLRSWQRGQVVIAVRDLDPSGAKVKSGEEGIVILPADADPGYGPLVWWRGDRTCNVYRDDAAPIGIGGHRRFVFVIQDEEGSFLFQSSSGFGELETARTYKHVESARRAVRALIARRWRGPFKIKLVFLQMAR